MNASPMYDIYIYIYIIMNVQRLLCMIYIYIYVYIRIIRRCTTVYDYNECVFYV